MGWLRAAFERAFEAGGENIVGPTLRVRELAVAGNGAADGPFGEGEDAATALRRLQVLGRLSAFNMSVGEYLHWRNVFASAPPVNVNGQLIRRGHDKEWSASEYAAAFAYVVDSTLKMERVLPDLESGGFVHGGFDKL